MINKIKKGGFTLIETLVAVMILSTAIAGPLTIASKGLQAALVAKDQVTAFYLAQDAVEYIRFARDSNRLGGGDWLTGVGAAGGIDLTACTSANGCTIDSAAGTNPLPCSATCATLKYNTTTKLFNYSSGTGITASYVRKVLLTQIAAGTEEKVTVTVTWTDIGGVTHPGVVVTEDIFNWQ
jgi:prepilin-type N-terminal cleavage/methylation domain-containing protein